MIYGNHIIVFSSDPFFADSYCNIPKTENPSNRSISILKRFPQKKLACQTKRYYFCTIYAVPSKSTFGNEMITSPQVQ